MKIELSYTTKLEQITDSSDVLAILDHKLDATSPAQTVDYMALALDHIKAKQDDISEAIAKLQALKKDEVSRAEFIKEECAKWLEGTGLDKLDGLIVSSVTVNESKPKENLVIENEEVLINQGYFKTVLDKTAVKQALQDGKNLEGATLEVTHVANKIRVNKKKK